MAGKKGSLSKVFYYFLYLLLIWTGYRYFFKLPSPVEEFLIKPVVWLLPILLFLIKDKKKKAESLGITSKNLFSGIYLVLALGAVFAIEAIFINLIKYDGFKFSSDIKGVAFFASFFVSLATAFTEEISFRGFVFTRVWDGLKNEWSANLITSLFWVLVHAPVLIFTAGINPGQILLNLVLTTIYSIGAGFIFARTKNVFSPVLLHVLWSWPILLFG